MIRACALVGLQCRPEGRDLLARAAVRLHLPVHVLQTSRPYRASSVLLDIPALPAGVHHGALQVELGLEQVVHLGGCQKRVSGKQVVVSTLGAVLLGVKALRHASHGQRSDIIGQKAIDLLDENFLLVGISGQLHGTALGHRVHSSISSRSASELNLVQIAKVAFLNTTSQKSSSLDFLLHSMSTGVDLQALVVVTEISKANSILSLHSTILLGDSLLVRVRGFNEIQVITPFMALLVRVSFQPRLAVIAHC
mmetsp:Transcript_13865/g.24411  ORF Transcript_13865/g.24411 Transcript_13865/m.24411 type:complete len:252 (-) Transcript_13865:15-770(-)